MASNSNNEVYDLLVLTDQTGSMGSYLTSLNKSLQDIIRISALTGCFDRVGVVAYGDYCGGPLTQFSGWLESGASSQDMINFVSRLYAGYGGDWAEATKTGLAHCYQVMRPEAKTIILLYTDAPPHTPVTGGSNHNDEQKELTKGKKYGDTARLFADWVSAAQTLRNGEKRAQVFGLIEPGGWKAPEVLSQYTLLCRVTGGACIHLTHAPSPADISQLTIGLLLAWMGVAKDGAKVEGHLNAKVMAYKDETDIDKIESETAQGVAKFIPAMKGKQAEMGMVSANLTSTALSLENLAQHIPHREPKVADFARRYVADSEYQKIVTSKMDDLISADVTAIAFNPVFGSLWRAVCNDRSNPMRDELITKFGLEVSKIADAENKDRMKSWLEESYDRVGEILETLASVPEEKRFPCVFLDPTLTFSRESADGEDDDTNPAKFTRDELLEIGRSCDFKILRRLGRVLTSLTYVNSEEEVPLHIKDIPADQVPRIPIALARQEYGRRFWKVLLHCLLPGTMLAGRPGALLAALSVRMGIKPLEEPAYIELAAWKNNWNTLDIPETWNTSCLNLLLDANDKVQQIGSKTPVLTDNDRKLFKTLVDYKLLEFNLRTTLTAKIGWHPEKTKFPMGPVVACKVCHFPRSVTVMGHGNVCGMCEPSGCDCPNEEAHKEAILAHVSKQDSETTDATWVECSMTDCRAQYIVYQVDKLNVRPKCFYCRQEGKLEKNHPERESLTAAPCIECTKCRSRIIWPEEYRPAELDAKNYLCTGCTSGKPTIVEEETSAKKLLEENPEKGWLLRNDDNKIAQPFNDRSLFYVISTAGTDGFADKVEVLPSDQPAPQFKMRGKLVHNSDDLVNSLRGWVLARRVESGTCSLCFSNVKKRDLRGACLRSGCKELVCESCIRSWYGINSRGRIINVAALACPFCRRKPSPKASVPNEIKFLGGLRNAVEESGAWIYAWCNGCGFAKRLIERVCAAGAPAEVVGWNCEECEAETVPDASDKQVALRLRIKECPGCGTTTEKMSGCDHITCPVEGCGTHWCFNCGKAVPLEEIYTHITREHGGLYGGHDFEEDGDDDGYNDEEYD